MFGLPAFANLAFKPRYHLKQPVEHSHSFPVRLSSISSGTSLKTISCKSLISSIAVPSGNMKQQSSRAPVLDELLSNNPTTNLNSRLCSFITCAFMLFSTILTFELFLTVATRFIFYKQMVCIEVRVYFKPKLKALFEKYQFLEKIDNRI